MSLRAFPCVLLRAYVSVRASPCHLSVRVSVRASPCMSGVCTHPAVRPCTCHRRPGPCCPCTASLVGAAVHSGRSSTRDRDWTLGNLGRIPGEAVSVARLSSLGSRAAQAWGMRPLTVAARPRSCAVEGRAAVAPPRFGVFSMFRHPCCWQVLVCFPPVVCVPCAAGCPGRVRLMGPHSPLAVLGIACA